MDIERQPKGSHALVTRIFDKAERLAAPELSQMGRPGLVDGTRELIEGPYIVVYKVFDDGRIVILTVAHGARDRRED